MKVGTNGIVVDQHGNVLLIKRNDTRSFAPPGGALNAGELPPDGAEREVREETGLIVLPVRLATVTYLPLGPEGFLGFSFRCLLRGGEIVTSEESPVVGFFKATPLPRRISSFHRERLEKALAHAAERPLLFKHPVSAYQKAAYFLLQNVVYRWLDVKRALQGKPPFQPPPGWDVAAYLLCANDAGEYLWHQPTSNAPWQLPGGRVTGLQAPWETAVQQAQQQIGHILSPHHLSDVIVGPKRTQLSLVFRTDPNASIHQAANANWYAPGSEPANSQRHHQKMVALGSKSRQSNTTQFHLVA